MGADLNKKNKAKKNSDVFKGRKAALGRGKHQHASHTKINLQTATLKVPTQMKFENTEKEMETTGPTAQQLQDILVLCHLENEKKILQGLLALTSVLSKSSELFLENVSAVLAASLQHLRNGDPKIRDAAQNLVSWIFGRHALACTPFLSVLVRHAGAVVSSPAPVIKHQSAFLLEKIAILPNLQPIPSLFELFPQMVRFSLDPATFSKFSQAMNKVLKKFLQKKDGAGIYNSQFPQLFPEGSVTHAHRFQPQCVLGADETSCIANLLCALETKLEMLKGESQGPAVADLCSLLMTVSELQPTSDLSPFVRFVLDEFPYEHATIKQNVVMAKFLVKDEATHDAIREFLATVNLTPDTAALFASIGSIDLSSLPSISECVQELCSATVSEEASPAIAAAFLDHVMNEPKITKRTLRALISFKKGPGFQERFIQVLAARLPDETTSRSVRELFLTLVTSCAPLSRPFLREFALLIADERFPEELRERCIEAVALTNHVTDMSCLLSFMMTMGARRPELREYVTRQIQRLQRLSEGETLDLFKRIDLKKWAIVA